jgi:hypothetical protein
MTEVAVFQYVNTRGSSITSSIKQPWNIYSATTDYFRMLPDWKMEQDDPSGKYYKNKEMSQYQGG